MKNAFVNHFSTFFSKTKGKIAFSLSLFVVGAVIFLSNILGVNASDPAYTNLDDLFYTIDDTAQTIKITGVDNDEITSVVLPASYTIDGVSYHVTSVYMTVYSKIANVTNLDISDCYYLSEFVTGTSTQTTNNTFETVTFGDAGMYTIDSDNPLTIGAYSFKNNDYLTAVNGVKYVKKIEEYAFSDCGSLTFPDFDDTYLEEIGSYAFADSAVPSFTSLNNVHTIADHAFYNCDSLTNVICMNRLTSIGAYAFSDCKKFAGLSQSDNTFTEPLTIGDYAFSYCGYYSGSTSSYNAYFTSCFDILNYNTIARTKYIGEGAFKGTRINKSIYIPETVTYIGEGAFSKLGNSTSNGTTSSSEVYCWSGSIYFFADFNNVLSIGDNAFCVKTNSSSPVKVCFVFNNSYVDEEGNPKGADLVATIKNGFVPKDSDNYATPTCTYANNYEPYTFRKDLTFNGGLYKYESTNANTITLYNQRMHYSPLFMSDTQNYGYVSGTNSYSNSVSEFPVPLMADGVSLIGYFDANGKELKKGDALGRYYINFEENRTLYAKYAFTDDVSFYANGGTFSSNSSNRIKKTNGSSDLISSVELPVKAGYRFIGWNTVSGELDVQSTGFTISSDSTIADVPQPSIYAMWEKIVTYAVEYDLSDGNWNDFTPVEERIEGESLTLPTSDNITKDGYLFLGWYDSTDTNKTIITTLDDTNHTDAVSLKALWQRDWRQDSVETIEGKQWRYNYYGDGQKFVAPKDGIYCYELWGAGNYHDVIGHTITYEYLREGDVRYVYVGGIDKTDTIDDVGYTFNGGSVYNGSRTFLYNGGGATDVRSVKADDNSWYLSSNGGDFLNDASINSRVAVAGGGYGGYGNNSLNDTKKLKETGYDEGYYGYSYAVTEFSVTKSNIYNPSCLGSGGGYIVGGMGGGYRGALSKLSNTMNIKTDASRNKYFYTKRDYTINPTGYALCDTRFPYHTYNYNTSSQQPFTSVYDEDYDDSISFVSAISSGKIEDNPCGFAYITYVDDNYCKNVDSTAGTRYIYDYNGGVDASGNSYGVSSSMKKNYTAPTKEDCTFAGWYADKDFTIPIAIADSSYKIFYAKWIAGKLSLYATGEKEYSTIIEKGQFYDGDNSTGSILTLEYYSPDSTISEILASSDKSTPKRGGYSLVNWLDADGNVVDLNNTASSLTVPELYAQWEEAPLNITFDANGGTFADSSTQFNVNEGIYLTDTYADVLANLSENPSFEGFVFGGWSISSDKLVKVNENDTVSPDFTSHITLYAIWHNEVEETIADKQWKYSYVGNGQSFVAPADGYYCYELWGAGIRPENRGYVRAYEYLNAGDARYVYVGSAVDASTVTIDGNSRNVTFNGGGLNEDSNTYGGGATDIRTVRADDNSWYLSNHVGWKSDDSIETRLAVAGGGATVYIGTHYPTYVADSNCIGNIGTYSWNTDSRSGSFGSGAGYVGATVFATMNSNGTNTYSGNRWGQNYVADDLNMFDAYCVNTSNLVVPLSSVYSDLYIQRNTAGENITFANAVSTSLIEDDGEGFAYITYCADLEAPSITLNANGGTFTDDKPTISLSYTDSSITLGELMDGVETPTREGYSFIGWYADATNETAYDSTAKLADLTFDTLYAHWESDDYEIFDGTDYDTVLNGTPLKFSYTGAVQKFVAPADGTYSLECWGSTGKMKAGSLFISTDDGISYYEPNEDSYGGGKYNYCEIKLNKGDILYVYVGGYDTIADSEYTFNGGHISHINSFSTSTNGGGATDIRLVKASKDNWYLTSHDDWNSDASLQSRIITAGGGGGFNLTNAPKIKINTNRSHMLATNNPVSNGQFGAGDDSLPIKTSSAYYSGGSGGGYFGGKTATVSGLNTSLEGTWYNTNSLVSSGGTSYIKPSISTAEGQEYITKNRYQYGEFDADYIKRIPVTSVNLLPEDVKAYYLTYRNSSGILDTDVADYFNNSEYFCTTNNTVGYAYITFLGDDGSITVSFNENGGEWGEGTTTPVIQEVTTGGSFTSVKNPFRAGYSFDGWFTQETGGDEVDLTKPVTLTEDTVLYAHWSQARLKAELNRFKLSIPSTVNGENKEYEGDSKIIPVATNVENSTITLHATLSYTDGSDVTELSKSLKYGLFYRAFVDDDNDGNNDSTDSSELVGEFVSVSDGQTYAEFSVTPNSKGNGEYYLAVSESGSADDLLNDADGNPVKSESIVVYNFDMTPPIIPDNGGITVTDVGNPVREKTVTINAQEGKDSQTNRANGKLYYYYEKTDTERTDFSKVTWNSSKTFTLKENGDYYIYVKDEAGNIASKSFQISGIDTSDPTITIGFNSQKYETLSDGKTLRFAVSVAGHNVLEDGNYQYSLVDNKTKEAIPVYAYASDEKTGRFVYVALFNDSTLANSQEYADGKKWFLFETDSDVDWTLTVTNNAGGEAVKKIQVDYSQYFKTLDNIPVKDGSSYITIKKNPEYDFTNSNVLLTPVLSGISTIEDKECFYWTDKADITDSSVKGTLNNSSLYTWLKAGNIPADVNTTYYLYVMADDGFIYKKSVTVSNIDKIAPTVSAEKSGSSDIAIRAVDNLSGIDYIRVYGSSMESLKEFSGLNGLDNTQIYTNAKNGVYYLEAYDKAGNCSGRVKYQYYGTADSSEDLNNSNGSGGSGSSDISDSYYVKVSFRSISNGIIKEEMVLSGGTATPPSASSMAWDGYIFTGWDTSYAGVTQNTIVKPIYVEIPDDESTTYYTVSFKDDDGAVIKAQAVAKGGTATPPTPKKDGYIFIGWDNGYANIQKDTECVAKYMKDDSSESKNNNTGTVTNTPVPTVSPSKTGTNNTTGKTTTQTVTNVTPSPEPSVSPSPSPSTTPEIKTEETEGLVDEEKEITLTEFLDEASLLGVSASDNLTVTKNTPSTEENGDVPVMEEGSTLSMDEFIEGTGTVEETQNAEYDRDDGVTAGQVVAVIALIGMGGAVVFYFLNKKYFWIDLPF